MDAAPQDTVKRLEPRKTYPFWRKELDDSEEMLRDFHKKGSRIVERYLDARKDNDNVLNLPFRLNLFHSNVKTLEDTLYGRLPKVEASRTFADSQDDVARVASDIVERINNLDIQEQGQTYDCVMKSCLQDRLLPGLGVARVRYEVITEEVETLDPVSMDLITETRIVNEDAPVDYYHWQDVRWGWSRGWADLPWLGFRSYLSKQEVIDRFGEKAAKHVEYKNQKLTDRDDGDARPEMDAPWQKAEIWEIWDINTRTVLWLNLGYEKILDTKDDPLGLEGFYPCPPFLMANQTTTLYIPTSDYHIAQDLYNEIDVLQTRISIITSAVKVVGLYNAGEPGSPGVARMLKEGCDNELIPVDNWAMFAEGGGLKGQIDWLPIQDIVNALDKLIQMRDQTIGLLQQITGMADVMRGNLASPYEGVGQTQIKAQFGSARIQSLQDQFARFIGDLFQLRTEVICKHFEPETLARRANMQFSNDADLVPQAIELLKQPQMAHIRVQVRPETLALEDYARLKSERTEFLTALATFMQSASPMLEAEPDAMPYLLKMLQWTMSGFKGSQEIEGILDKAVEGAIRKRQQEAQNPKPDPEQQKAQAEMQKMQAKVKGDMQLRQQDLLADIQTAKAAHMAKMAEIQATHQARMGEIFAKYETDIEKEAVSASLDIEQSVAAAQAETEKDAIGTELEIGKEIAKSSLKIDEITASSMAKIDEIITQAAATPEKDDGNDQ